MGKSTLDQRSPGDLPPVAPIRRRVPTVGVLAALLLILVPVTSRPIAASEPTDNPLYVSPDSRDFSQHRELLERILSGPHHYFRFINVPFSREVCRRFADRLAGTPSFNLHGDAHMEQYAVTDSGRGLTDFDDSSTGPAILDLARLGTSLHLACRAQGCGDRVDKLLDSFLEGYRQALEDPSTRVPEPQLVTRLRSGFSTDREAYLQWVESVMEPMPEAEGQRLKEAVTPYIEALLLEDPLLSASHFRIIDAGYLRLGVGSAMARKYLIRMRGETDDPLDDLVLEVKQVSDLSDIECITVAQATDPFRILVGQARIAYQPYDYAGYMRMDGRPFWIHAWVDNYEEIDVRESFSSEAELAEVLYDAGLQLGLGHPRQIAAPLDTLLRREQMRLLDQDEEEVRAAARDLAELTVEAWEAFRLHYRLQSTDPAANP